LTADSAWNNREAWSIVDLVFADYASGQQVPVGIAAQGDVACAPRRSHVSDHFI